MYIISLIFFSDKSPTARRHKTLLHDTNMYLIISIPTLDLGLSTHITTHNIDSGRSVNFTQEYVSITISIVSRVA